MKEYCGVFGLFSLADQTTIVANGQAKMIYYGLFALQHRGQESAGIAMSDGKDIIHHKEMGLVNQVFNEEILKKLKGRLGIGHVRYSTTGSSVIENAQPIVIDTRYGPLALAHNGNLVNSQDLRQELKDKGISFVGTTDSEVMAAMIATSGKADLEEAIAVTMKKCRGAFAVVILSSDKLIAVRDQHGIRPLSVGRTDKTYVIASETCALDIVGAQFVRDVANGEMVVIDDNGLRSRTWEMGEREAVCVFEYICPAR